MKSVFLLGATSSGKHETALLVAEKLGAEIISIDSMKVYRGMDIGTAKPSPESLSRVVHHLIDNCDPSDCYNAGKFVEDAERIEKDIRNRGKVPFYVGGTALYYKALVYGLFQGPNADPVLREELLALAKERGNTFLHQELSAVDPLAAQRIHENDLKRLIRALEVYRKTGKPITSFQTQFDSKPKEVISCWIDRSREDLRDRTAKRTRKMFEAGLPEEVKKLLRKPWGKEGLRAVGYRQIIEMLDGLRTVEDTEVEINRKTGRFIRRQITWFRSFSEAKSIPVAAQDSAEQVSERILRLL